MRRNLIAWLCLAVLALAPLAAAQDDGGDGTNGGDGDVNVDAPENVDVNVDDNEDNEVSREPEESAFFGLGTTALIVIIVVAVLLVTLIAVAAGRDW